MLPTEPYMLKSMRMIDQDHKFNCHFSGDTERTHSKLTRYKIKLLQKCIRNTFTKKYYVHNIIKWKKYITDIVFILLLFDIPHLFAKSCEYF